MEAIKPVEILNARNIVGECILWDSRRGLLWWTDIPGRELYRHDFADAAPSVLRAPDRIGSFGFVAGSERLIAAFAGGIGLYEPGQGTIDWLARPDAIVPGIRFNDGRVDRRGRFWSGTMVEDEHCTASGCLYSVDRGGEARCHVRGIRISNGLCTSPDGRHMYFADSPTRTIFVYDLVEPEGRLGPARVFARTPEGALPDGAAVDVDGCLWSAHWGAGCVVRYTPEGRIDRTIQVPACQPTCVCFGGPDLDLLCVTSAREGLDEARLQAEPHAGAVFLYRTGVQGLPEPEYLS
ncbi:MAG TPA: SMP-30/gluconolactonase/LRE family protein [Steroidobacteraceae bacterium]